MKYALFALVILSVIFSPDLQAKNKSKNKNNKSSSNNDIYRKRLIVANEKLVELEAQLSTLTTELAKRDLQEKIDTLKRAIRRYEIRLKSSGGSKSSKDKDKSKK